MVDLEGSLQSQLHLVQALTKDFEPLQESLNFIEMLDNECIEAHTEENDYTVYSLEDLKFGLDLVKEAVQKKSAFIQNQVSSRYSSLFLLCPNTHQTLFHRLSLVI